MESKGVTLLKECWNSAGDGPIKGSMDAIAFIEPLSFDTGEKKVHINLVHNF